MNCKECELINNYPCVDYGICPQVDDLENIVKKMTQAAWKNKCSSDKLAIDKVNENELSLNSDILQRRTDNNKNNYYLDETKFCLTVTNFCSAKCGNRIKIGERLPQVHIKMTRRQPLQIKSGRGRNCESCANFDWWNGECMKDECKNDEILANAHKAADFNVFPFSRFFRKLQKQLSGKALQIVLLLRRAALREQGLQAQSHQRIAYALKLQPHRGAKRIKLNQTIIF